MKSGSIYDNPFAVLDIQRAAAARAAGLSPQAQMDAADEALRVRMALRETHQNNLGIENAEAADIRDAIMPALAGQMDFLPRLLTGSQAKTAYALRMNAENMIKEGGLESIGFLTLTLGQYETDMFGDEHFVQVTDSDEASRRINNLNRRFLADLFEKAIIVTERHKSEAIHFHILGILRGRPDIRTGLSFEQIQKRNYSSAPEKLRELWAILRDRLPGYGFGRAELMPVRTNAEAVACYVSKYIEKNVCNRTEADHRKKLVRYLGWDKKQLKPNEFSWASPKACAWRCKTRQIASLANVTSREEAAQAFGPRWAHDLSRLWMTLFGDATSDFLTPDGKYKKPVFAWTYPEREFIRAELATMARTWTKRKEAERFRFSEEMAEIREKWPDYCRSQFRQPQNQRN